MNKRIIALAAIVVMLVAVTAIFAGCSADRAITIRIAAPGEYMDSATYNGFADWYYEKTGKKVLVEYNEFDTLENLYTWISIKKEDYDLICPSDYMIQRLDGEGLVQPINDQTRALLNERIDPRVIQMAKESYDPEFKLSAPYMWGTLGIMFNVNSDGKPGLQNELDEMNSWDVFWNAKHKDKIFMKDSVRDAYSVAAVYNKRKELRAALGESLNYDNPAYREILLEIFDRTDDETIKAAEKALMAQKRNVHDYEVDSAKDELLRDSNGKKGYFGLFWSCDAGYIMTGEEDDTNKNLYYTVPEEGSNVWLDAFVIPTYSKNPDLANAFIEYLSETDIGYECMDYAGATTAVKAAAEEYKAMLEEDEDGFFEGTYEGFREMYMEMMFPSDETLKRCAIMKDYGEYNQKLDEMWMDVILS